MILKSFHVRVFRNIVDSGPIKVVGSTCLVGKNEAGKSSTIEGLHRLNPARPMPLVLLDDYPRWLKKQHEILDQIKDAVPISAVFQFSKDEFKSIETQFGEGVLSTNEIIAERKYTGDMLIELPIDQARFIKLYSDTHIDPTLQAKISAAKTAQELPQSLDSVAAEVGEASTPTAEAQSAKLAKAEMDKVLRGAQSLIAALEHMIKPLIPKTFYFSNYSQLRGRYNLPTEVVPALSSASADEGIQAAADFLKLARIAPTDVQAWDFEQSNAELESISGLLTQRVKANWKQNEHLKLVVRTEPAQNQNGQISRRRYAT